MAQNNTDYNNAAVFTFANKTEMTFDIKVRNGDAFGYISIIDIKIITPPVDCTPYVVIASNAPGTKMFRFCCNIYSNTNKWWYMLQLINGRKMG